MAKGRGRRDEGGVPPTFAETTPPQSGADLSMWLLNAHSKIEGTLGKVEARLDGLRDQLSRIEGKVDHVEREVAGHGKWIHTLKAGAAVLVVILSWILVNALWPWARAKLFPGS